MIASELMQMMKAYLNGEMSAEDFSFDFPARLAYVTEELEKENQELSDLLNEEMPETCCNYEPDEKERRSYPDVFLSKRQMQIKTAAVYQKALRLLES